MAAKTTIIVTLLLSAFQAINSAHDLAWKSISEESKLTKTTFQTDWKLVRPTKILEREQENGTRLDTKMVVECPEKCDCVNTAAYCTGNIPLQLPPQIRLVTVTDLRCRYLQNQTPFTHNSWRQVKTLNMLESMEDDFCDETFIEESFLGGLNGLNLLKIDFSFMKIDNISFNALSPLTELEILDMSGCTRFRLPVLSNALRMVSVAPKISTIIAERIGNVRSPITGEELKDFAAVLANRNVSTVNLSSTQLENISYPDAFATCRSLKLLNMSHARILSIHTVDNRLCDSIKILDISGINLPTKVFPAGIILTNTQVTWKWRFIGLASFSTLYASDIYKDEILIYNTTIKIDFGIGPDGVNVQNLYLAGNNWRVADVKFVYIHAQNNTDDFTFPVEVLDLSRNGMKYVSPGLFNNMKLLHQLDISHNNLNMMERNMIFGKIFTNISNLHIVDLSYNNLSTLPADIFVCTNQLQDIDLSSNRLKSLSFNMTQLMYLEYLDISQNEIASLDQSDISAIQEIVKYQQGRRRFNKTVKIVEINMRQNPLKCSCKTLHFIRWFVQAPVFNRTPSYTCNIANEQIPLDASAIEEVVYICDRPKRLLRNWVIGSTTTVVGVVLLITAVRFIRYKLSAHKRTGATDDVIRRFRDGQLAQKYILFLSHSSQDDDLVIDHVYPELKDRLQRRANIMQDPICTGTHFHPGRSLFSEMDRCLDSSCVFVPVVTLNYVRSYWCKEEFKQAHMKQKPMIIFFAEHVPPDVMPKILRDLFMGTVRVKIRLNNGELNIQPGWKEVCDGIFYSVAETGNATWNIKNIIGCFRNLCCRIWYCKTCCHRERELVDIERRRLV